MGCTQLFVRFLMLKIQLFYQIHCLLLVTYDFSLAQFVSLKLCFHILSYVLDQSRISLNFLKQASAQIINLLCHKLNLLFLTIIQFLTKFKWHETHILNQLVNIVLYASIQIIRLTRLQHSRLINFFFNPLAGNGRFAFL